MTSRKEMDRVCGMWLGKESAPFQSTFNEETYYFCSQSCKEHFDHDQEFYLKGFEGRKPF